MKNCPNYGDFSRFTNLLHTRSKLQSDSFCFIVSPSFVFHCKIIPALCVGSPQFSYITFQQFLKHGDCVLLSTFGHLIFPWPETVFLHNHKPCLITEYFRYLFINLPATVETYSGKYFVQHITVPWGPENKILHKLST